MLKIVLNAPLEIPEWVDGILVGSDYIPLSRVIIDGKTIWILEESEVEGE